MRELGAAIRRHQRSILRCGDKLCAVFRRGTDQARGVADIFRDIIPRTKLNAGGAEFAQCSRSWILAMPALAQGSSCAPEGAPETAMAPMISLPIFNGT